MVQNIKYATRYKHVNKWSSQLHLVSLTLPPPHPPTQTHLLIIILALQNQTT